MSHRPTFGANQPPQKPDVSTAPTAGKLDCVQPFRFVFSNPQWVVNVLLLSLCGMIPVIGPMVGLGFQAHVMESLYSRRTKSYPDFDMNQFMNYLTRGVWPFVASLTILLILVPVLIGYFVATFFVFAVTQPVGPGNGMELLVQFSLMAVWMVAVAAGSVIVLPLVVAAKLTGDLKYSFNGTYLRQFLGMMWKDMLMMFLAMMLGGTIVTFAGLLLCCVGVFLSGGILSIAYAHFSFQLYELFLERGGMRLPVKPVAFR
jgi:hypothetical protein